MRRQRAASDSTACSLSSLTLSGGSVGIGVGDAALRLQPLEDRREFPGVAPQFGDIAVLDILDLDRVTADALVEAGVAGVVNASPSISGRYPNLGPEVLVANNIVLIDNAGPEIFKKIKDGAKIRLHDSGVYSGDRRLARRRRGHRQLAGRHRIVRHQRRRRRGRRSRQHRRRRGRGWGCRRRGTWCTCTACG